MRGMRSDDHLNSELNRAFRAWIPAGLEPDAGTPSQYIGWMVTA